MGYEYPYLFCPFFRFQYFDPALIDQTIRRVGGFDNYWFENATLLRYDLDTPEAGERRERLERHLLGALRRDKNEALVVYTHLSVPLLHDPLISIAARFERIHNKNYGYSSFLSLFGSSREERSVFQSLAESGEIHTRLSKAVARLQAATRSLIKRVLVRENAVYYGIVDNDASVINYLVLPFNINNWREPLAFRSTDQRGLPTEKTENYAPLPQRVLERPYRYLYQRYTTLKHLIPVLGQLQLNVMLDAVVSIPRYRMKHTAGILAG